MSDIKLRPYQQNFIDAVRNEFIQNHKRVVGVAPCGAGKTIMTGWMIRESAKRGKRSIFFVHRKELIEQTSKTFLDINIEHGIICAGYNMQPELPVQIASVQTLANRLDYIPAPDFLICDECHHILANTYKKIIDAYPNAFLLGVTATPLRMGGITLVDSFDSMVESLSVDELINLGNPTSFKYFAPAEGIDLHNVRTKFGEYVNSDLEIAMSSKKIIGNIVDNYLELAEGKSAICYCVNVNHSKSVADTFNQRGISAAHCDGETPKKERSQIVDNFRQGKIKVLCNAELFGEGFDVPGCQAVILARPTYSLTLFIQQSMRAMRPDPNDPNKVAIIIDHVQNYLRHGLPNDDHNWSLEPNEHEEKKNKPRKCPKCNTVIKNYKIKVCPNCGYQFPIGVSRKFDTDELSGELIQVDVNHETNKESTLPLIKHSFTAPNEFLAIAKRKNYKIGWVAFQSLKHAHSYDDCLHIADICGYNKGWAYHKWQQLKQELKAKKILAKSSS